MRLCLFHLVPETMSGQHRNPDCVAAWPWDLNAHTCGNFHHLAKANTTAQEIVIAVARIVLYGTFVCLVQCILAGRYFLGLRSRPVCVVVKVAEELSGPEVPQLLIPEQVLLHFVQVVLSIRILLVV